MQRLFGLDHRGSFIPSSIAALFVTLLMTLVLKDVYAFDKVIFAFQGHGFQGNYGWYSLDPAPGLHAVFLDSTTSNSHGGHIPKIELDWLDKDLYENRDKLTVIFLHH